MSEKMSREIELHDHKLYMGYGLACPTCHDYFIHHVKVEVWDRDEDDKTCVHTTIENSRNIVDRDLKGNPSPRRHGFKITFWCENCNELNDLVILQHKGETYIRWLDKGES